MTICTATPAQLMKLHADCKDCGNRKIKSDGSSMCVVKHIDCSVRKGQRPCSHFTIIEPKKENKRFNVFLTACATQVVEAPDRDAAAKLADWCDAEFEGWEVSEIEEI